MIPSNLYDKEMPFIAHMDELRKRITRCFFVFLIGFVICFYFSDHIMTLLRKPLFAVLPVDRQKLYFTHLFENFLTHLRVSGYSALILFLPYYLYEAWSFIAPGLYSKEKKHVILFVFFALLFFAFGMGFAYWVIFPSGFKYFLSFSTEHAEPLLKIDSYYGMCLKLFLIFGISFEVPVFLVLCATLGTIDAQFLKSQRKMALIAISIAAALFAPPDAISMILMIIPLFLLYEGTILFIEKCIPHSKTDPEVPSIVGESKP
jgi:sec-independent protein translocase protein TatC